MPSSMRNIDKRIEMLSFKAHFNPVGYVAIMSVETHDK